jgi:hypothetical protein
MVMGKIKIVSKSIGEVLAELSEKKNPKTADAIWLALPFKARANRWSDEIFFSIPVKIGEENAQQVVEKGDVGYWPLGNAFRIFFSLTPAGSGNEIFAASPVTVFGKILGNANVFKKVKQGEEIKIKKAD